MIAFSLVRYFRPDMIDGVMHDLRISKSSPIISHHVVEITGVSPDLLRTRRKLRKLISAMIKQAIVDQLPHLGIFSKHVTVWMGERSQKESSVLVEVALTLPGDVAADDLEAALQSS